MGNRAIIKAEGNNNKGVYLHWNGGRDSVEGFLKYCELRGFRSFEDDYGMARFIQVVGNFLGANGLSIGVTDHTDSCGDNGVYIVKGWEIVGREDYEELEQNNYDLTDMLLSIDVNQPLNQQLGEDFIVAEEISVYEVKIGDEVFIHKTDGRVKRMEIVGIGEDRMINGTNVKGLPYFHLYGKNPVDNINNYVRKDKIRAVIS